MTVADACLRTMKLVTVLNRWHRIQGFVSHNDRFPPDQKSLEISVRPRKGSVASCSRCHRSAQGYDQLAARRLESIPFFGGGVFLPFTMRRLAVEQGAPPCVERKRGGIAPFPG